MIKRGISGGMISISSLIDKSERTALANSTMIKTSSTIREAAKIGLQSLYANADEVLEKYKDFDIIKEMKARNGANLLWVRARAIDADVCNANGDYFEEAELTKEVDYQGKKMPAYKTFEGVPIYTNHKNDNIEEAKGMVVYAEWDDEEKCVYCVFFIDEDAYPDIARGVRQGYVHDVSMGCFPKGTLVLTQDGYKEIEIVQETDKLVDANGLLTNIINRQIKLETEKIYEITFEGGYAIKCTKEHPILAVDQKTWNKRVKRNNKNKPQRAYHPVKPDFIEARNLKIGDMLAVKTGGEIIETSLTIDQAKLLGLFAAEGNYLKYKNEIKEIEFTFSIDEKETLVQECAGLIKKVFDVDARIYERTPKNTIIVRVYSEEIAKWFKYHIGEYSYGKTLSEDLRFANEEIQKAFICSWIKGDGCVTHKSLPSNGISVTTCSLNFAKDATYILTRLGFYHKIYAKYENKFYSFNEALKIYTNSKGFDGRHMSFNIELPSFEANKIAKDCNFICNTHKVVQSNKNYTDGYILRKIKDIKVLPYNGPVYNFETASHTYTVSNIGVHNCSVEEGKCSICGNKATTERDYCDCLKKYKGKMHPSGKKAFEYNYGIKFIELSCVGDGAFESCEIMELYDQDELLQKAEKTIKSAQSLNSSITLAASMNEDISQKREIEQALRQLQNLNKSIVKIAQTAGTLVGGQLIGNAGAQNATVVKVLQGLGIDPSGSLNILDLVNLALNFLEVAVLNLFSRKDNIDLTHVAKLTKAMGELQNTLQDMIDDGIETAGQKAAQPMIPAQGQQPAPAQPAQPVQEPAPAQQAANMAFTPAVGQMISPFSQQPMVMPLGGGVSASNNNVRMVWASTKNEDEIIPTIKNNLSKFGKFAIALNNLREACGIPEKTNNEVVSYTPQNNKISASSGDKKIMDHFKKIASDLKKQNTVALAIDIKLDDQSGNRVVLSTDKGIKGYHNGHLTNWSPNLTEAQLSQMESGDGYRVAADLLKDFSQVVKTAADIDALIVLDKQVGNHHEHTEVAIVDVLDKGHKGHNDETMQQRLNARRKDKELNIVMEELLGPDRTNDLVRIVTELGKHAKKNIGDKQLEEMLHPNFGHSVVPGKEIMCGVMDAVAKTCVATSSKPEAVLNFLTKSASSKDFAKILKLARLGTPSREYNSIMNKFAQAEMPEEPMPALPETAEPAPMEQTAIEDIADTTAPEATEGEIISALNVIKDNFSTAVEKLTELLDKMNPAEETKEDEMKEALESDEADMDNDSMKGAVTGLSIAGEETGAQPEDMVDAVNEMPIDVLASSINEARKASAASARAKQRATRKASIKDLNENIVGWLADVANDRKLSTDKVALAAKLFCSYKEAAIKVLNKSIKTSDVHVVDETTHTTTIMATLEDIGAKVEDAAFNQKFRDFAVDLLSQSGYEVDPTTFALTEINVSADGMVCGKVSTKATKTFRPEVAEDMKIDNYVDKDRQMMEINSPALMPEMMPEVEVIPSSPGMGVEMVMSNSAKQMRKLARIKNIVKVAQGLGLPGAPAGAPGAAAPAMPGAAAPDPMLGGMAGGGADLGVGSLTGASPEMGEPTIDETPEPGNKSPWGSICPQCGSKDVDIANGEGNCNACGAKLKYKFIVEVAPPEEKGAEGEVSSEPMGIEAPAAPVGGLGAPEAGLGAAAPAPAAPGMAPLATSLRVMKRIAYKTSAEVYAKSLSEGFNPHTAEKLPVGMCCPACGSRTASKKQKHTYCYDCGTMSVSEVKKVAGEPGALEASIVWI